MDHQLSNAARRVCSVFDAHGPTDEVEVRLGRRDNGRFVPGVDKSTMEAIVTKLEQYQGWYDQIDWAESVDYFAGDVRYTTGYDHRDFSIKHSAVRKRTLASHDLISDAACDMRVSRKQEQPVDIEKELPVLFKPDHVRIKQRRTFTYRPSEWDKGVWRYDLTMVWSGATKTEAERWQQRDHPPLYEVEIEYVGGAEYLQAHGASRAAHSMLLKCGDLLGDVTSLKPIGDAAHAECAAEDGL